MPAIPRIDPENPPYADLRRLLRAAFEPEALYRLSEASPFQPLRNRFAVNDNLDGLIDKVLSFCRTQLLWEELLDAVAGHSPRTYNHHAAQLGWAPVPEPEVAPGKPPGRAVPPPSGPTYDDVEIHVAADGEGRYRVRIKTSLTGDGREGLQLPWTEGELRQQLARLEDGAADRASLAGMGAQLFDALFRGAVRDRYAEAVGKAPAGLRLRLWMEPPELQALPWELLYDEDRKRFLALTGGLLVTRYLTVPEGTPPLVTEPPLRVLVVTASPLGPPPLEVEAEAAALEAALAQQVERGLVQVTVLHHARTRTLNRALRDHNPHVLHFAGHGSVGPEGGLLLLEDRDGQEVPLPASEMATLLTWTDARVAVLNACLSGRDAAIEADLLADRRRAMLGVGPALVHAGLGAVVANQFSMADPAACLFAEEFYTCLADFDPVDEAVSRARVALMLEHGEGAREWATPVLFLRAPDGVVFHRA